MQIFRITAGNGRIGIMVAVASIACLFSSAEAQQLASGTSGRQYRNQAVEAVPLEVLTPESKQKLVPVLEKPSVYRRLPVSAIRCDEDFFRYLVRQPEIVVEIWKLMGVTKMQVQRTGPFTLRTDDGAGTISDLELVYGDGQKHIFYAKGTYEGPVLRKKLSGRCVLVLQSVHDVDQNGVPRTTGQMDVFIRVDNAAAGVLAKTIQPLVGPTADHNFSESLRFFQRLYDTTVRNGPGVQMMGQRLQLQPDVLAGFQQVAGLIYERGLRDQMTGTEQESMIQVKSAADGQRVSRNAPALVERPRSGPVYRQFGR